MENSTKEFLLALSRKTILSRLDKTASEVLSDHDIPVEAINDGACFVTLTINGELRGCIGTLEAGRPIYRDVIANSLNAAFNDPRFFPLNKSEFPLVKIEISVLSPRTSIEYSDFSDLKSKVIPHRHGVYLSCSYTAATFLPQVWEQLETHEEFFSHLCLKAGLPSDYIFKEHPGIELYTVENFYEK